jgi:hypothetical protein
MADEQQQAELAPRQEGSRWRYARPSGEEVATWFQGQPIDDGMQHADYVNGVVIIPNNEKVRRQRYVDGKPNGSEDAYEMVFTPYVTINTRVRYFHNLAKKDKLIPVIEPVPAKIIDDMQSPYYNANLGDGLWWYTLRGDGGNVLRWLCSTWRVALYEPHEYNPDPEACGVPVKQAAATKQTGAHDGNATMRAETGAIGRALGVLGILVVGSGIATAEDIEQLEWDRPVVEQAQGLPVVDREGRGLDEKREAYELVGECVVLWNRLKPHKEAYREATAWYGERAKVEGWKELTDAPLDALKGIRTKILAALDEAQGQARDEIREAMDEPEEGEEKGK